MKNIKIGLSLIILTLILPFLVNNAFIITINATESLIHEVFPTGNVDQDGDNIQAVIDSANPGDTDRVDRQKN